MDNVGQSNDTGLTPEREAIIGGILAFADVAKLPARPWPLVVACQTLAKRLPAHSWMRIPLKPACDSLDGGHVVESWLWDLTSAGAFVTEGSGTRARWVAQLAWLAEWKVLTQLADSTETRHFVAAGQALATALSRWEKASSAA